MELSWSPQQEHALESVTHWLLHEPDKQVYTAFGFAGTGKTTMAKEFAKQVKGEVYFAAYTGKAAHVLHQQGCPGACTIHKLIYIPSSQCRKRLDDLESRRLELMSQDPVDRAAITAVEISIREEKLNLSRPMFQLNLDSWLQDADLLIIDECSMVGKEMAMDILRWGCKVLVLGDPAQLPPIKSAGYFTDVTPDILLTEIHRQAAGNPIIDMSKMVRERKLLRPGNYGESRVVHREDLHPGEMRALANTHDQMLVGRNKSRRYYNRRMREIRGYTSALPMEGDRLVCLRNNHEEGLLNGQLWTAKQDAVFDEFCDEHVTLKIEDETGEVVDCLAHEEYFQGGKPEWYDIRNSNCFDYGYALTVHKAQGSQWDSVLLIDEWDQQHRQEWLYTAITRAAKRITIIQV